MNNIKKIAVSSLGYNFIPTPFLPKNKDEYYLRNKQNRSGIKYRNLNAYEIEVLVRNRNSCDNWYNLLVSELFNPDLVRNCKFFGLVRIGKLEALFLEFNAIKLPVGLYNSTIISCDFGDNVVIDNVNYISHYIIGNEAIIVNVNEMANTNYSKFGNGIIKDGEEESIRIWMELCNENGGRKVIPFSGMLPGDAYLWTRNRDDEKLLEKFKAFTQKQIEPKRGFYGKVGDRTVIKNCKIIKDVWVGSDAYLKGANKIKNVTINSDAKRMSQIGEGCEIVNGIIGYGCKLFYGVKAVRFVMSSHSQLKYGARLINSYLGSNATISCCEVLNSLIFPSHEQHHNNSFLCAALIMGQSNLAAGATIGSNHNSRAADGEIIANRGFWPGLCVSLKHNSMFASFTMIAKGDYPAELNIKLPFSLLSNEEHTNSLVIMPAYWPMYNMYALARNAAKYKERDLRIEKIQLLEFDYLAPDTINEIIEAKKLLELYVGEAFITTKNDSKKLDAATIGKKLLLQNDAIVTTLNVVGANIENSKRTVKIIKVQEAYNAYSTMVEEYCYKTILEFWLHKNNNKLTLLQKALPKYNEVTNWENIGGQLMDKKAVEKLKKQIKTDKINSWEDIRQYYITEGLTYPTQKLQHALAVAKQELSIAFETLKTNELQLIVKKYCTILQNNANNIYDCRQKDYNNQYRAMVYNSKAEMDNVMGKLDENSFINEYKTNVATLNKSLKTLIG